MNRLTSLLGAAIASVALLAGTAASAQQITGAGATFPNPLYQKWGEAAQKAIGVQLNYQSVGSGAGLTQARKLLAGPGAVQVEHGLAHVHRREPSGHGSQGLAHQRQGLPHVAQLARNERHCWLRRVHLQGRAAQGAHTFHVG